MSDQAVMTLPEVADLLRLGRSTLYAQVRSGTFPVPPMSIGARKLLFSRKRIHELIDGETEATA